MRGIYFKLFQLQYKQERVSPTLHETYNPTLT
jgi:hypothetical protein